MSIPTGLSDEEDAHRHLAIKFGGVLQCPNCELRYYSAEKDYCWRCEAPLTDTGFVLKRKHKGV